MGSDPIPGRRDAVARTALPLLVAGLLILLQALGPDAAHWLRLESEGLAGGEWWRLVTGNLVHLSWAHLAWNLAALALLWVCCGPDLPWRAWVVTLILTLIGTGLGLAVSHPKLGWYVGFSGVLHGLFVTGAMARLRNKQWDAAVVLGLVVVKILYEQISGPLPGVEEAVGGPVLVDAHLFGALSGAIAAILLWIAGRVATFRAIDKPKASGPL